MTALDSGQLARVGRALRRPCPTDAQHRAPVVVRMDGGRVLTGRLVYWPVPLAKRYGGSYHGGKAAIVLASGRHLNVRPDRVELALPLLDEATVAEMDLDAALAAAEADTEALS